MNNLLPDQAKPSRFPNFDDVEMVCCLDNFELCQQGQNDYLMSWRADSSRDAQEMIERSPTLAKMLRECEPGSPFIFMHQKLKAFGLGPLDGYLFRRRDDLVKLSPHFGGKDSQAFDNHIGFTVRIDKQSARQLYDQIMQSQPAEEMPVPYWRFRWSDLPGGDAASYVVFRRPERKDGFGKPLTNARIRQIFRETYPNYPHGGKEPFVHLCFDAALRRIYIVTDEDFGHSISLSPEEYEVRAYSDQPKF